MRLATLTTVPLSILIWGCLRSTTSNNGARPSAVEGSSHPRKLEVVGGSILCGPSLHSGVTVLEAHCIEVQLPDGGTATIYKMFQIGEDQDFNEPGAYPEFVAMGRQSTLCLYDQKPAGWIFGPHPLGARCPENEHGECRELPNKWIWYCGR